MLEGEKNTTKRENLEPHKGTPRTRTKHMLEMGKCPRQIVTENTVNLMLMWQISNVLQFISRIFLQLSPHKEGIRAVLSNIVYWCARCHGITGRGRESWKSSGELFVVPKTKPSKVVTLALWWYELAAERAAQFLMVSNSFVYYCHDLIPLPLTVYTRVRAALFFPQSWHGTANGGPLRSNIFWLYVIPQFFFFAKRVNTAVIYLFTQAHHAAGGRL